MNRELADKWCERAILGLVLTILVFGPLATGAVRALEFLVLQGVTILVVMVWLLRLWINPRPVLLWPPICWAVLAFVGYAIFEYRIAEVEYLARRELIRVLIYGFLFFVVLNNLNRQEATQTITFVLIFLAMALAGYAIYQFTSNSLKVWHFNKPIGYLHRGGGTYINPNHLAGFLEMILPIGIAYTLMGRFSHTLKVIIGYCCLVMLVGIGVTLSRGGWIATGVTLFCFFAVLACYREYRIPAVAFLIVLTAVGIAFMTHAAQAQKRIDVTFTNGKVEDSRFYFWPAAIKIWHDRPWVGGGPGHFDYRFRPYRQPIWQTQVRPGYVHNDYLNTLADWGAIGIAIIAGTVVLLAVGVFKTWPFVRRSPNDLVQRKSNRAAFVYGASFGLVPILLHSVTDFNMQIPANAILAITLMALVTGYQRFATERFWIVPGALLKIFVSLILLAGTAYLGLQEVRTAKEYFWVQQAKKLQNSPLDQVEMLKKAFAADPKNFETASMIGETLRAQSWEGNSDYETLAKEAIEWFQRAAQLNPLDPYNFVRQGMCLDWLKRHDEALKYFQKGLETDPNSYFTVAEMGWHYLQIEDYTTAKKWFEKSLEIYNNYLDRNSIAANYLEIVNERLAESTNGAPKP